VAGRQPFDDWMKQLHETDFLPPNCPGEDMLAIDGNTCYSKVLIEEKTSL
jgi:hypothetical protein